MDELEQEKKRREREWREYQIALVSRHANVDAATAESVMPGLHQEILRRYNGSPKSLDGTVAIIEAVYAEYRDRQQ